MIGYKCPLCGEWMIEWENEEDWKCLEWEGETDWKCLECGYLSTEEDLEARLKEEEDSNKKGRK
ncbi:hypothetical protein [Paenibacillus polymyxa]|uniref:hypothetical protein n=1 Tax=Paenibacillus polymyxa TaxID=1406 RepID=UPI00237813B2|nr:hypothetical protein [Paenibacillus polymyxa]WDM22626.1 hypothetical protein J4I02_03115 [Paenibacillus polymyxa]